VVIVGGVFDLGKDRVCWQWRKCRRRTALRGANLGVAPLLRRPGIASLAAHDDDSSILTAYSDDYQYERYFHARSMPRGRLGDVFVGISTSGPRSSHVLGGPLLRRATAWPKNSRPTRPSRRCDMARLCEYRHSAPVGFRPSPPSRASILSVTCFGGID